MSSRFKDISNKLLIIGKFKGVGTVLDSGLQYKECLAFSLFKSKPLWVVQLSSQTWTNDDTETPLHAESGILKISNSSSDNNLPVEASFVHPFSLTEFEYGYYNILDNKLDLEIEDLQRGKSAKGKLTSAYKRTYWINKSGELQ